MDNARWFRLGAAAAFVLAAVAARAEPGDAEAVAQARKDYAQAMRGHDAGLQNAMRAELAAQLAMAAKRASLSRHPSRPVRPTGRRLGNPAMASERPDAGQSE